LYGCGQYAGSCESFWLRWAGNLLELGKKLVEGSQDLIKIGSSWGPAQHSQMLQRLGTPPWHTHHPTQASITDYLSWDL